eukprot:TRINITY_DN14102_c0_g1_i1.p1 TRINITY_DN14102_c0_g1~~TRINITY_DN14102_c0_g1_i1.p1  ORF type:complete len:110 (-),score=2.67 TRINITY_DN14102_c0_g1_i1:74-403(-)
MKKRGSGFNIPVRTCIFCDFDFAQERATRTIPQKPVCPEQWYHDSYCVICDKGTQNPLWLSHCRNCGHVACRYHLQTRCELDPDEKPGEYLRTCTLCYEQLQGSTEQQS